MKKLILFFSIGLLSLTSLQLSAQRNAYELGDKTVGVGITLGTFGLGYPGTRSLSLPPITFSGEYGLHEYVSAGAYLGFGSWRYRYDYIYSDYSWKYTQVAFGARGSLHYVSLLNEHLELEIDPSKFDFYVTILAGLEFGSFSSSDDLTGIVDTDVDAGITLGSFLGFEYMVTEQIGVFVETGWNAFGYLTFGATARF